MEELIEDINGDFQNNGLANFQSNAYIIGKLRQAAERRYLLREEFCLACYIKYNFNIVRVRIETCVYIEERSFAAFNAPNHRVAISELCNIDGVNIATASAILAWTFPTEYGVIDQRAWRTLVTYELHGNMNENGTKLNLGQWNRYHYLLNIIADETQLTPQQIDTWLYNKDRELRLEELMNQQ